MRFFKMFFVIVLLLGVVGIVHGEGVKTQEQEVSDIGGFLDERMERWVKEANIPNATVAVVYEGDIIFSKGYGFESFETKELVDPNHSLFRIGSISKLFTWTAVMQLVEQGKLDLDTDINEYIDFDIPDGPSDSDPITLRHLLTHTPGFEDYLDTIFRLNEDDMPPLAQYVKEYLPERVFPAGEIAAYSNYGTTLAGYIVEHVSGMDYSTYIEKSIYAPLKMENSTFKQPLPTNLREHMAQSYRYVKGEFLPASFEYMPAPAGGMSSSATDMAKYMEALLENDGRILQANTWEEMKTQQFTQHPYLDGITLGFIEKTINDKRLLIHGGSTMIYDSGLYLLPEEELGIFISYSGGNYLGHTKIVNEVMDHYFPAYEENSREPLKGMKERSKQYVGEYHQNRRSFTTTEKFVSLFNGAIQIKMADEGYLLITHMGSTNPFVEIEDGIYKNLNEVEQLDPYGTFATIVFKKDANDVTTLMTDGPMSYSKAPWYATSGFTLLSLMVSMLIIIGSLVFWVMSKLIKRLKRRKREQQPKLAAWTKMIAVLYSVGILLMLFLFSLGGEMSPIYGLPKSAYTAEPSWTAIFNGVTYLLELFSLILLVMTVFGWRRRFWRLRTHVFYSMFTFAALVLSWLFYYWNIM